MFHLCLFVSAEHGLKMDSKSLHFCETLSFSFTSVWRFFTNYPLPAFLRRFSFSTLCLAHAHTYKFTLAFALFLSFEAIQRFVCPDDPKFLSYTLTNVEQCNEQLRSLLLASLLRSPSLANLSWYSKNLEQNLLLSVVLSMRNYVATSILYCCCCSCNCCWPGWWRLPKWVSSAAA